MVIPYNVGECSDVCATCVHNDKDNHCVYIDKIRAVGYDDKGNHIVVACDMEEHK